MDASQDRSSLPADWPVAGVNGGFYIEPVSFPWPDRKRGPFWITVRWCLVHGEWQAVGLALDWAPGAKVLPLQRKHLARIKMGDVLDRAARELEKRLDDDRCFPPEVESWLHDYDETGDVRRTVTTKPNDETSVEARPRRSDRPSGPPARLEEVARVYNEAYAHGKPTKAVQEHFGVKLNTAKQWVFRARKAGLLPAAHWGIAKGTKPGAEEDA